jgi:hypothetical protein
MVGTAMKMSAMGVAGFAMIAMSVITKDATKNMTHGVMNNCLIRR